MRLDDGLRPSVMKYNSRFRGPTELDKYGNFIRETVHDLAFLGKKMDRNEDVFHFERGQSDFIQDNFAGYTNGTAMFLHADAPTAVRLNGYLGHVIEEAVFSEWVAYGGCTVGGTNDALSLTSPGVSDPSGIRAVIRVETGDILLLRAKVTHLSGTVPSFAIGSDDANLGEGSYTQFTLGTGDERWVEHRIYCKENEEIHLNLDVHRMPAVVHPGSVQIEHFEVMKIAEEDMDLGAVNTGIKARVNKLEEELQHIIENL